MMSKLYKAAERPLFLNGQVGTADGPDGERYDLQYVLPGREMVVVSQKTGNLFMTSWQDVINEAVEAGVNDE